MRIDLSGGIRITLDPQEVRQAIVDRNTGSWAYVSEREKVIQEAREQAQAYLFPDSDEYLELASYRIESGADILFYIKEIGGAIVSLPKLRRPMLDNAGCYL